MQFNPKPIRLSPLHNQHQTLNARFDLRGGWLIPEVYTISGEEVAVLRENIGLTDIGAWGKLTLKGANARAVLTACFGDVSTKPGEVREIEKMLKPPSPAAPPFGDASRGTPPRAYFMDRLLVAGLTPDEFLILTPPGAEKELATSLEVEITSQNIFVSVIDQTSGLVGLSISGPKSMGVMRKLCAIPFNSKEFPNLCVAQSSFAKVRATILHHDRGDLPTFELFADCSYGEYLWEAILDAGREFGMQPVGWEAMGG